MGKILGRNDPKICDSIINLNPTYTYKGCIIKYLVGSIFFERGNLSLSQEIVFTYVKVSSYTDNCEEGTRDQDQGPHVSLF